MMMTFDSWHASEEALFVRWAETWLEALVELAGGGEAFLTRWQGSRATIVTSTSAARNGRSWNVGPEEQDMFSRAFIREVVSGRSADREQLKISGPWAFVANAPVVGDRSEMLTLTYADDLGTTGGQPIDLQGIRRFATSLAATLEAVQPGRRTEAQVQCSEPAAEGYSAGGDDGALLHEFLLSSLVQRSVVRSRGGVSFHGCRTWRANLKEHQIKALRLLKTRNAPTFVAHVADELLEAAERIAGAGMFQAVAAVPCGHSGPGCLADKLAARLAARLDLPHVQPFAPLVSSGSSHPVKNGRRDRMKLVAPVAGSILLVDDVATSGAHIAEAAGLLRRGGAAAMPLVWIVA